MLSFCFAWYLNFRKVFIPSFSVVWSLGKDQVLLLSHKKFKTTLINCEVSLLPFSLKSSFVLSKSYFTCDVEALIAN